MSEFGTFLQILKNLICPGLESKWQFQNDNLIKIMNK